MSELVLTKEATPSTPAVNKVYQFFDTADLKMKTIDYNGTIKTLTNSVGTFINVMDYGAKGDGSTDDTTTIQAAIDAAEIAGVSGRGVAVIFPPGVYKTTAALTVLQNNVILMGSGVGATVIYPTHLVGDVIQFGDGGATQYASIGLQDMQIFAPTARTSGAHINLNYCADVTIKDFAMNNPAVGILVGSTSKPSLKVDIRKGHIDNILVTTGIGIQVNNGIGGDTYITDIVSSNPPASKPLAGINIVSSGHCSINRCNMTSCNYGLYVNPGASQDVQYLFIDGCLFDSCGAAGAYFYASNATAARIRSVMSINSWYSGALVNNGILFNTAGGTSVLDGLSFVGCRILNNYQHGVLITAGTNISFTDCTIAGNGQQTINTYDGINIAANVNNVSVINCALGQCGTATNQQRYAINVAAGTSAGLTFLANTCAPNGTVGSHGYINIGALTGGGITINENTPGTDKGISSSRITATAALNTTHTVISDTTAANNRLTANAIKTGFTIKFVALGTNTSTVAGAATFRVLMGTNNTTADTAVLTAAVTSAASGTAIPFRVEVYLVCRTIGASSTWYGYMCVHNVGTTGIYTAQYFQIAGTMATVSTQQANYINLSHQTAAATTTNTFQMVSLETVAI
jgi:hypothetical protein